jgi:N utilization substance protein A
MRGRRIQHIVDELNGEKIDVIAWSPDTRTFIRNALSPAKPIAVLLDESDNGRTATVIVPDRQLSLSIGREGQNARLAAKLTGWRIDIKGETEATSEGLMEIAQQQLRDEEARKVGLLEAVQDILREGRGVAEARLDVEAELAETPVEAAEELAVPEDGAVEGEAPDSAADDAVKGEEPQPPEAEVEAAEELEEQVQEVQPSEAIRDVVGEPEAGVEGAELPVEEAAAEPEYEFDELEEVEFDVELDEEEEEEDEEDVQLRQREADRRRDLERRRRVVYDEELGQTIAIRRRKRGRSDWSEEDEYL